MNKNIILTILLAMLLAPVSLEAKSKKKEKEPVVPQPVNYPSAEVSEYRLHGGNVVINGKMAGREEDEKMPQEVLDQLNGLFSVIMRDYVVGKEKTQVIEFTPDGTFSMNVYVPYPMFLLIHPGMTVYACPGDTLEMTIDLMAKTREEAFIWDGTGLSGEVTKLYDKIRTTYCGFPQENAHEQGPDSLMKWKDRQVARLDDLVRKINGWSSKSHRASTNGRVVTDEGKANAGLPELEGCSPLAADILRTYIFAEHLKNIYSKYLYMSTTDKMPTDSAERENYWQQFFSFVAPREKYLTDNPLLMIASDETFFNILENSLMKPVRLDPQAPHDKPQLSPTDFSTQVCLLRHAFRKMKWNRENYNASAEDLANILPYITHPKLIRHAVLAYREYVKENELPTLAQKPMTKGDSIFQRIIEPYKGNVLYVDFWQMSCGPCRAKMLQMRDEVEANKDKPVKYLYITNNTPEDCQSFLEPNNIKGEHIHITRAEWGYLQEKFNFSAIPFVLLFDKQGKRRDDATVEQLLEE